jgi:hypothetical protein
VNGYGLGLVLGQAKEIKTRGLQSRQAALVSTLRCSDKTTDGGLKSYGNSK